MHSRRFTSPRLLLPAVLVVLLGSVHADETDARSGRKIDDFALPDGTGKSWSLHDFKDKKAIVVVFLGTECPINNAYLPRLAELHKSYASKAVQFLAINANRQDTAERLVEHARQYAIPFPVLKDKGNVVADQFAAQRTPEAFLLDAERRIRYHGRIDDQYGVGTQRPKPSRRDLVEALDEVLAGKAVTQPATSVAGCIIARAVKPKAEGKITYARDVSRILQKHCQECHRPGQIGPMALLTYDDALSWAEMIREVVEEKRMPPWHADPRHGKFANDRSLPAADRDALLSWIKDGCPKGDERDLPPPRTFASGWRIGKPDAVFPMVQESSVPAEAPKNGIPYRYYIVPTDFKEDMWVQAAEAKPGNRAVVHHIIVYVRKPGQVKQDRADGIGDGFLAAYAPGDLPMTFPAGMAKKIPKGSFLVFQMHYTPNGKEQTDRSSIGLVFAKEPPQHQARTRSVAQNRFTIPPGDSNHQVVSTSTFPKDILLVSLFPHMHLRGKDFAYRVVYPDGKTETILSVPRYDFNWQNNYLLEKPFHLPAGSKIECTAHFDNSTGNPNNPDPTQPVRWGDQTWQEMMIGFVDYVYLDDPALKSGDR